MDEGRLRQDWPGTEQLYVRCGLGGRRHLLLPVNSVSQPESLWRERSLSAVHSRPGRQQHSVHRAWQHSTQFCLCRESLFVSQLRCHAYMLHKNRYFTFNRRNFFSIRIVNMWNSLPAETTDFSGLDKFNKSVSNMFVLNFCQVNFVWISPCDTETYCMFLCYYVHV